MWYAARVVGRFAREALAAGEGEVCAAFRRSVYLRLPGERYACVGDASLGRGPLNALVEPFVAPPVGSRLSVSDEAAVLWQPPPGTCIAEPDLLKRASKDRVPAEGFGCLILGEHNALAVHAQPALEAIDRWLVGNALGNEIEILVGLGPGLTPSGDDYLGGVLVTLRQLRRAAQAETLWRWLQPRLAERTSAVSAAHLAAAAAGEGHEALHEVLNGSLNLDKLAAVGHCSGWDALAGATAVLRAS